MFLLLLDPIFFLKILKQPAIFVLASSDPSSTEVVSLCRSSPRKKSGRNFLLVAACGLLITTACKTKGRAQRKRRVAFQSHLESKECAWVSLACVLSSSGSSGCTAAAPSPSRSAGQRTHYGAQAITQRQRSAAKRGREEETRT